MQKGERFEFVDIRRNKVDYRVPACWSHFFTTAVKSRINALVDRAEDVSNVYTVNSGGNVQLLRYLFLKGTKVVGWKQEGLFVKVRISSPYFSDTFIYI